tara:strand:+ start:168 stop:494 length:327 start_codon:yes stop_codon:yes gene_type:complete
MENKDKRPFCDLIKEIEFNGEKIIPLLVLIKEITNIESLVEVVSSNYSCRVTCLTKSGKYANLVYSDIEGFQFSITRTFLEKPSDYIKNNYNQYPLFKMMEVWGFDLN